MNYYKILRLNRIIKNNKLKILGVGGLFLLKSRYLNVFLDPILNCNLKCLMCYFSDPDYKPDKARLKDEELEFIAKNFFPYALKLQIGCGTEPSLYTKNEDLIKLAKKYKVPFISFTSNVSILNYEKINSFVKAGLNEIIVSMHGTQKEVYEKLMCGASYEHLHEVLNAINEVKKEYPDFNLRINYTVNPDNIDDLAYFDEYIEKYNINVIQIRPIRKLGNTIYSDFNLNKMQEKYSEVIDKLEKVCEKNNIITLITRKLNNQDKIYRKNPDIAKYTYCYISPNNFGDNGFKPELNQSYRKFLLKNKFFKKIFYDVFFRRSNKVESNIEFGNYDISV